MPMRVWVGGSNRGDGDVECRCVFDFVLHVQSELLLAQQALAAAERRATELEAKLQTKDHDTTKQIARLLADLESLRHSETLMQQVPFMLACVCDSYVL